MVSNRVSRYDSKNKKPRNLQRIKNTLHMNGYLLPVTIFLALAISILGVTSLRIVTSSSNDLNNQFYQTTAKQAAESGLKVAMNCIASGTSTWGSPLTPKTDCSGSPAQQSEYIATGDNWKSTYSVPTPVNSNGKTTITVFGKIEFYNKLNVKIAESSEQTSKVTISSAAAPATQPSIVVSASDPTNGAGRVTSFAVTSSGQVYSWGYVWGGMLGNGTGGSTSGPQYQLTPTAVDQSMMGGAKVTSVVTSTPRGSPASTAYAITDDGKVYAWGLARWGQMGNGTGGTASSPLYQLTPTPVNISMMGGAKVVSLTVSASAPVNSAGTVAIYALTDAGKVYGWGYARGAQMGNGTGGTASSPMYQLTPTPVDMSMTGGAKAVQVVDATPPSSAAASAYIVTDDGKAYAWGSARWAQLGNGTGGTGSSPQYQLRPTAVNTSMMGGAKIKSIVTSASDDTNGAGRINTYALTDDGKVYGWGYVWGGMLGNGTGGSTSGAQYQLTPTALNQSMMNGAKVTSLVDATPAGSPASSMYAITDDGKIYAWGLARWTQMGNGTGGSASSPLYQLTPTPVDMSMMNGAKAVAITASPSDPVNSAGTVTIYAVMDDGRAYAWGYARGAQLGNGTGGTTSSPMYQATPVQVGGASASSEFITSLVDSTPGGGTGGSAYAVGRDGKVFVWGTVRWAQIGNGTGGTASSAQYQLWPELSNINIGTSSAGGGGSIDPVRF